ncbi:hypothetical protein [Sphingobacterium hungaricum]|uniref:Outer membrane protein beta-barrel domain-containing protein n=1 Tax=Sphingobacterium hungaricum TaxID=2082723 RepID=A0A928UYB9_9SPHI|nr:hypothetical protein [Sphingobacterium hungaricum]MBE8715253.1 hypothetical protein [Sphingobacterium hungaricum]
MKTILLTLSLLAGIIFTTQAQTEAGKIIVGGRININTSKIKDSEDKNNGFSILPQVGFFVANNIAIGAQIGYSWGDARTSLTFDEYSILLPDISNSTFVATPFGRLYTGDGSLKFFGQLSAPLLFGSFEVDGEKN